MAQITTRFVGSGVYQDGTAIAWPVNPWVVYDGEYTRPVTKKFRIVNQALYELDGTTPAVLPPSYVPQGVSGPVVYPSGCYYGFEIFQGGRRAYKGFLQVPYDPADAGVLWYNFQIAPQAIGYPAQIDAEDNVKQYANSTVRDADEANILKGTIVFVVDEGVFYGRTSTGWVPLYDSSGAGSVYDIVHFGDSTSYGAPTLASSSDAVLFADSTSGVNDTLTQESVTEGFRFADAAIADTDFAKVLTDTLHLGDALIAAGTNDGVAADGLIFSDVSGVDDQTRQVADGVVFGEQFTIVTTETFQMDTIHFGDSSTGVAPGDPQPATTSDGFVLGLTMATKLSFPFDTDGILFGDTLSVITPSGVSITDGMILGIDTIDTAITVDFDTDSLVLSESISTTTVESFPGEALLLGDSTDSVIT